MAQPSRTGNPSQPQQPAPPAMPTWPAEPPYDLRDRVKGIEQDLRDHDEALEGADRDRDLIADRVRACEQRLDALDQVQRLTAAWAVAVGTVGERFTGANAIGVEAARKALVDYLLAGWPPDG